MSRALRGRITSALTTAIGAGLRLPRLEASARATRITSAPMPAIGTTGPASRPAEGLPSMPGVGLAAPSADLPGDSEGPSPSTEAVGATAVEESGDGSPLAASDARGPIDGDVEAVGDVDEPGVVGRGVAPGRSVGVGAGGAVGARVGAAVGGAVGGDVGGAVGGSVGGGWVGGFTTVNGASANTVPCGHLLVEHART
jgi:hypothetical protein